MLSAVTRRFVYALHGHHIPVLLSTRLRLRSFLPILDEIRQCLQRK